MLDISGTRVETLPDSGGVLVEHGPLRLVIKSYTRGDLNNQLSIESSQHAFLCLEELASEYRSLQVRHGQIASSPKGELALKMVESVITIGDADLTPMAAVAGTIADSVADWLMSHGADKAIVNNGGDIAIRISPKAEPESIRVGLRPDVGSAFISHRILTKAEQRCWGINTSGLGGRSLTRGIASAVTVFAATSSRADAAATAVANACFVNDSGIVQVPANSLDPNSDLGDLLVTAHVGALGDNAAGLALENGLKRASELVDKGHIDGAMLVVKGRFCLTSEFMDKVGYLEQVVQK